MNPQLQRFHDALATHGCNPKRNGKGWEARCPCPAHEDKHAGLSFSEGDIQPVVLKCHAGCDTDSVLSGLGLIVADVSKDRPKPRKKAATRKAQGRIVATYPEEFMKSQNGAVIPWFVVVSIDPIWMLWLERDGSVLT